MDEVPEIWNAAVPLRPAAVWRCANVGQVRDAVRRARAEGMPLSVLGGGHDWAGRAVRDGAQVIDLSGMREVKVDGGVATVGGGATANDWFAWDCGDTQGCSSRTKVRSSSEAVAVTTVPPPGAAIVPRGEPVAVERTTANEGLKFGLPCDSIDT